MAENNPTWEEVELWMKKYVDTFGEMITLFGMGSNESIIEMIKECLRTGKTQYELSGLTDDDII